MSATCQPAESDSVWPTEVSGPGWLYVWPESLCICAEYFCFLPQRHCCFASGSFDHSHICGKEWKPRSSIYNRLGEHKLWVDIIHGDTFSLYVWPCICSKIFTLCYTCKTNVKCCTTEQYFSMYPFQLWHWTQVQPWKTDRVHAMGFRPTSISTFGVLSLAL